MGFDISNFLAQISSGGFLKTSNFEVLFTRPNADATKSKDLVVRTDKISLPSRQPLIYDLIDYGIPSPVAYGSAFNEGSASIILSEDLREKLYFEEWYDIMIGNYRTGDTTNSRYDINYLKNYAGTIDIFVYKETGEKSYSCSYKEVVLTNIGAVSMDWANGNEIARLEINFKYKYYTEEKGNK